MAEKLIIDGRKVVALFDDMTGGGASRFMLAGNDDTPAEGVMPRAPWAVVHARRKVDGSIQVVGTHYFLTAVEARGVFLARVGQYVSPALSVRDVP
jgi:hypothetical protein